jgi:hypothetical protein
VQQSGSDGNGPVREKADPSVIRRALPEYKPYYGHRVSGVAVHHIIGSILHAADPGKDLVTEAAIAGANRNEEGLNLIGIADLYKSTPKKTVTGVKGIREVEKEEDVIAMDSPAVNETRPRDVTSSPVRTNTKPRGWRGDFPETILLGEIKPWTTEKAAAGWAQLDHYQQGYTKFVERIHKVSGNRTRPSISFGRLDVTLPSWLNFDNWETEKSVSRKEAEIKDRRLWVARVAPGVYLYTDFAKGYKGPPSDLFSKHLTDMRKVRAHITTAHPKTEKIGRAKFIQRNTRDRPPNYWPARALEWEKERSAFAKPYRAALKTTLKDWREKVWFEKKLGRAGRSVPTGEQKEIKDYKDLMFWSSRPGKVFGRVRFLLGGAWDKALGVFEKMKEKVTGIRTKVLGIKEGGLVKTGWASRLIQVVVAACKVAFSAFITESFNFFADCFHSAMDTVIESFKTELNERFTKEICEARKLFEESKAKLETEWGEATRQIEGLVEAVQDVKRWTDIATTSIDLIRVGVQIISCVSPPALGCLWGLVAQLGIGAMVGLVIGTQWFNDNIVTPNVRELVRKHIAPHYQTLINRALGEGLKKYHCRIAEDAIPSMQFQAKGGIEGAALRAHRDSWEAEFEPEILKDLQAVFGKPGGRKPTKEALLELVKKMQDSKLSMEDLKDRRTMQELLEQSLDPKSGKLNIDEAKRQAEKIEAPAAVSTERKIDFPNARKQNAIYQKLRGWDPVTFVTKPGIKVDSEEFSNAVYDMQVALRIKADGILGDETLVAFYDKNKKNHDLFYAESIKALEEKEAAEAERNEKNKGAKDTAAADKATKDKGGVAPPTLSASVKVLNANSLVPHDRSEKIPRGIGIFIPNVWSLLTSTDNPKAFKIKSPPHYVILDVHVDGKHEYRIENVAVRNLYVANMAGAGFCWWTLALEMEDGIKLQTSNGLLVKIYMFWCLSAD